MYTNVPGIFFVSFYPGNVLSFEGVEIMPSEGSASLPKKVPKPSQHGWGSKRSEVISREYMCSCSVLTSFFSSPPGYIHLTSLLRGTQGVATWHRPVNMPVHSMFPPTGLRNISEFTLVSFQLCEVNIQYFISTSLKKRMSCWGKWPSQS